MRDRVRSSFVRVATTIAVGLLIVARVSAINAAVLRSVDVDPRRKD